MDKELIPRPRSVVLLKSREVRVREQQLRLMHAVDRCAQVQRVLSANDRFLRPAGYILHG